MVRAYRHDRIRKLNLLRWNITRGLYWGSLNPEESTASHDAQLFLTFVNVVRTNIYRNSLKIAASEIE